MRLACPLLEPLKYCGQKEKKKRKKIVPKHFDGLFTLNPSNLNQCFLSSFPDVLRVARILNISDCSTELRCSKASSEFRV
jgi:hypothetical protein